MKVPANLPEKRHAGREVCPRKEPEIYPASSIKSMRGSSRKLFSRNSLRVDI
jgi:hypothetical protein